MINALDASYLLGCALIFTLRVTVRLVDQSSTGWVAATWVEARTIVRIIPFVPNIPKAFPPASLVIDHKRTDFIPTGYRLFELINWHRMMVVTRPNLNIEKAKVFQYAKKLIGIFRQGIWYEFRVCRIRVALFNRVSKRNIWKHFNIVVKNQPLTVAFQSLWPLRVGCFNYWN